MKPFPLCLHALLLTLCLPTAHSQSAPLETPGQKPGAPLPPLLSPRTLVTTPFGTSYQVNVDATGQNIAGDAANEPSLCVDPTNPNRIAVAWRQFDTTNSNFRQAGWGYSTNAGVTWNFGGKLQTNVFRSDPVLAADAEGRFYYLSLMVPAAGYECDMWRSLNGGASWQSLGPAVGGDKSWMTIDTTPGPGHGTIYQAWDSASVTSNRDFSFSYDGGLTWTNPFPIPQATYWGTLDVGPEGQVYLIGWDGAQFWVNRSTNATNRAVPFVFDSTVPVDLGGGLLYFLGFGPNPGGLIGQAWVAADRSTNSTRGNVYALCSVGNATNLSDIMLARSTDGGVTWDPPVRINTDVAFTNAWHWFGAVGVAPNGRVDVCWYDTRNDPNNNLSQLFYSYSIDGGVTWSTNMAVSPPFNSTIGFPSQNKIGDYTGVVSLNDATCIAYSATFNSEEDVYFLRLDQTVRLNIAKAAPGVVLSWNAFPGVNYCLQYKSSLSVPWPIGTNQVCLVATNAVMSVPDPAPAGSGTRFYRVVREQ